MRMTVVLLALLTVADPAQAMIVSPKVGPLLKEAQTLIAAKDFTAARAKVDEAEAVKVSADDETVINQFRQAIAAASMDRTKPTCTSQTGITNCNGYPAIGRQP